MATYTLEGRTLEQLPDVPGQDVPTAPCAFCGKEIRHFNDGGVGWIGNAGPRGTFMFCDQPQCEGTRAAQADDTLRRCVCGSEVIGDTCDECGRLE